LVFPSEYFKVEGTSGATTIYFISGIILGTASLVALRFLTRQTENCAIQDSSHKQYNIKTMWQRLRWPASANFLCLCVSSVSPVFASRIVSVIPETTAPILQRTEFFVPLAYILWNIGDLLGAVFATFSRGLIRRPFFIFVLSLARILFIPLYLLCNIDGRGSFTGDWFYLVAVQFSFGLTHGWLSATSMSGVPAVRRIRLFSLSSYFSINSSNYLWLISFPEAFQILTTPYPVDRRRR
jgi:equilibrative nucleoside transporter 1/2/3